MNSFGFHGGATYDDLATHKADNVTDVGGVHGQVYEEGTWTPEIRIGGGATGITYTVTTGSYILINNVCYVNAFILLSSKGTLTGNVTLQGFPFSVNSAVRTQIAPFIAVGNVTYPSGAETTGLVFSTVTAASIRAWPLGTTFSDAHISDNTEVRVNFAYKI